MVWNRDAHVTATEACTWLPIRPARIRDWARTGRITAVGARGTAKLYRWGDLIDAERATRLSRRSSRNEHRRPRRTLATT